MVRLDTTSQVRTPERVELRYRIAGPGRRGGAYLVDLLCRGVILAIIAIPLGLFSAVAWGASMGGLLLLLFFLEWGYGAFFEWILVGRTPGKALFSLRVVREDGAPVGLSEVLLRNLVRAADFLPGLFAVGLISMLFDDRARRLGDLVGGTMVIVEERDSMLGTVSIEPPVSEEERQAMPTALRLTQDELRAVEEFLRRRVRLSAERTEELASLLGPQLSERFGGWRAASWTRTLTLAYARTAGRER